MKKEEPFEFGMLDPVVRFIPNLCSFSYSKLRPQLMKQLSNNQAVTIIVLLHVLGYYLLGGFSSIIGTILISTMIEPDYKFGKVFWFFNNIIFWTLGPEFVIAWNFIYLKYTTMELPVWLFVLMCKYEANVIKIMDELSTSSIVGFNDMNVFSKFACYIMHGIENLTMYESTARYLREVDLTKLPKPMMERKFLPPAETVEIIEKARKLSTSGYLILLAVFLGFTMGLRTSIITVFFMLYIVSIKDTEEPGEIRTNETRQIMDGVYRLEKSFMGYKFAEAIGYAHAGVLHVPYHHMAASDVKIRGKNYKPTYSSKSEDITTYCGHPSLYRPTETTGTVIVALQNDHGEMLVTTKLSRSGNNITFPSLTEPGQSGSPVFYMIDDTTYFIGLAGVWCKDTDGNATELIVQPSLTRNPAETVENCTELCRHPGFGKTRKEIPRLIRKFLLENKTGKIIISGPTVIICESIYRAILPEFRDVGARIRSVRAVRDMARIQVMAHDTLFMHLVNKTNVVSNVKHIILDESHTDFASTRCMVNWLKQHKTITSTLMSATFPDKSDSSSNYPIEDHKFKVEDLSKLVDIEVQMGNRVLIFVPGKEGKNGWNTIKNKRGIKDKKLLVLNRETYPKVSSNLDDPDIQVIISTNIAECGVNIDVDTVIDLCENFYFKFDNNRIFGVTETIAEENRIQRRGRVGRTKPGKYYFTKEPIGITREASASHFEAWLMSKDLDLNYPQVGNPSEWPHVSTQLISQAVSNQIPITEAILDYDHTGRNRHEYDMKMLMTQIMEGDNVTVSCGIKKCPCEGTYLWWDDRLHDKFLTKMGLQPLRKEREPLFIEDLEPPRPPPAVATTYEPYERSPPPDPPSSKLSPVETENVGVIQKVRESIIHTVIGKPTSRMKQ
uniref:Genome polyprotein n=1 Tax=Hemipteran jingmen-related virus TaxID=2822571 RepID=A0A8A6RH78_9FLAV|nr:NS3 [Hemipteran jingmen-related virus]